VRFVIGAIVAAAMVSVPVPAGGIHPDHAHQEQPKDMTLRAKPKQVDRGERVRLTSIISPCVTATAADVVQFRRAGGVFAEKASIECRAVVRVRVRRLSAFSAFSPEDLDSLSDTSNTVRISVRQG
jgi:hypothetical protein